MRSEAQTSLSARPVLALLALAAVLIGGGTAMFYDAKKNIDAAATKAAKQDIFTDQETGCEYIVPGWGGITPRLDRGGKPMGCGTVSEPVSLSKPERT